MYYADNNRVPGVTWLQRMREKVPNSVWLNPEPERFWDAPTITEIGRVFPMFGLTLDGIDAMAAELRRQRSSAGRRAWVQRIMAQA